MKLRLPGFSTNKGTYHYRYAGNRRRKLQIAIAQFKRNGNHRVGFAVLGLLAFCFAVFALKTGKLSALISGAAADPISTGVDLGAFAYDGLPVSSSRPVSLSAKGAGPPATPSNLVATAVSDTEINLTWRRNSQNETGIAIQRSADEVTWNTVYTAPSGADIWTDTSLFASRAYHYRIATLNKAGSSAYTAPVVAVTQASPVGGLRTPTDVQATAMSSTTARISFTDPNASIGNRDYFIERSDDGGLTYQIVGTCNYDNSGPYNDDLLKPKFTYYYRLRGLSTAMEPSAYTDPVSVTMPARRPGAPIEPADTKVVNKSATSNTISWTDTNHGAASYIVERTPWAYDPDQVHFSTVGQTASGATSFTDTGCTAENSYSYRVKAINGTSTSDYDQEVDITTASVGTGSPKTYNIGPGQTYPTIGSLNWRQLGPGDTVDIHGNGNIAYHELILVTERGTPEEPITIQGVPDSQGHLPIIDGTNAVQSSQFAYNYAVYGGIGCITTYRTPNSSPSYRPGYLVFKNLELRNCYAGDDPVGPKYVFPANPNTFTDYHGQKQPYHQGAMGIYLLTGDNITIEGCNIHGNGQGVFGAGQSGFFRYMGNIVLRGNYIWGNGNINSFREHNSYIESIGVLYEYNHYGPERAGAIGSSLKDRSVGTVIRYNYIESSARIIDLVEAQNESDASLPLPAYHYAYIYGNVLAQDDPRCANGIHYGGDQGMTGFYRKGVLYLWNNTIISTISEHDQWRSTIVQLSSPGESLDARNNIIAFRSLAGGKPPELDLIPSDGIAYFGVNWVSSGWRPSFSGGHFTGLAAGTENFITGSDPGFVSWVNRDYHLAAGSPCIGKAGTVSQALAHYSLDKEYAAPTANSVLPQHTDRAAHAIETPPPATFHLSALLFPHSTTAAMTVTPHDPPDLGVGASLNGKQVFPADNPWNQRVDNLPVDPNSNALIGSIGADAQLHPDFGANWQGGPFGIPYMVVAGDTKPEPVTFDYADQSDPGPYPIPQNAPIESANDPGADHHILVIDRDHWRLYELFSATWTGNGWHAGSGAIYDLSSNVLRPAGWTSADAAGLPIFPGLVRYDEVEGMGEIDHALRFTARRTRRAYIFPARHFASRASDPDLPPMGMRVRLKASFDISNFPPESRVVLQALKTYGMILADNGSNWFISGAPDARWDDNDLSHLKELRGSDFEVVKMGPVTTR